ncbi:MAG: hypothetical protein RIS94_2312 [Pseudomonadota bacterium]|jgi:hypothetical protein
METVRRALREAEVPAVAPAYRVRLLREKVVEAPEVQPTGPERTDLAPDRHIEQMVAHEREGDDEGADLLDSRRPVE